MDVGAVTGAVGAAFTFQSGFILIYVGYNTTIQNHDFTFQSGFILIAYLQNRI